MIIGYDRPTFTYTLTHGVFVTDSARLTDGRPMARTRIKITPDASNLLVMECDFGTATIAPGIAGLIGTDLPVGNNIICDFIRTGDGSYGYLSKTRPIVQRRDGVSACWFAQAIGATGNVHGVRFQIDVTGVPLVSGDGYIEIGELWASPSIRHEALVDYKRTVSDNSDVVVSTSGQQFVTRRQQSTSHTFSLAPEDWGTSFGNHMSDLAFVRQRLCQKRPAVITPYVAAPFGGSTADDSDVITNNTEFGIFDDVGSEEYDKGCVVQFSSLKFIGMAA